MIVLVIVWPGLSQGGGPGESAARRQPHTPRVSSAPRRKPLRLGSLLRDRGPAHERTVRFTHTAWNASDDDLRGVEVGIAVPESDFRQTVLGIAFTPPPLAIDEDAWGQRTARFRLERLAAGSHVEIEARIRVRLRDAEWHITDRDVGGWGEIPEEIIRQYLRDAEPYGLRDARIVAAGQAVHTAEGGPLEQVRRIHDFVADRLVYERDHRWDSAGAVLERGRGSCSEYCYLMIALCRINGIPARYAGGTWLGHAQTQNAVERSAAGHAAGERAHVDRVFHRWVEVYLPRIGWYPVDPTENDRNETAGEHYRFFGRLPWSRLTLLRGDGDLASGSLLGRDYRSGMRWSVPRQLSRGRVWVDRVAVWLPPTPAPRAAHVAAAPPAASTVSRDG